LSPLVQALQFMAAMHLHEPFPLRRYLALSLLGLGCGFVGAVSGARIASNVMTSAMPVPHVTFDESHIEMANVSSTSIAHTEAMPAPSDKPGFVIEADGDTWFVLAVDPGVVTGRSHLAAEDGESTTTIASVRERELTPELRAWRGQRIDVDGCIDVLHDFALVHVVTGDPVYADDIDHRKWTARSIEAHGTAYVVAKLDHCTGTLGRAVSAPPLVTFTAVDEHDRDNDPLASKASELLMASATAMHVKAEFLAEAGNLPADYDKALTLDTIEGIDMRTRTKWIAVHANAGFACGGPNINFWGLYRAVGDHLVTIKEAKLETIANIQSMIDLDGDGVPELVGGGWISPTSAVFDIDEQTLLSYNVPFFGCPC
jgi:hypothetical protein